MRPKSIRLGIKRWLLLTPVVAQQLGCSPGWPFGSRCGSSGPTTMVVTSERAHATLAEQEFFLLDGGIVRNDGGLFQDGGSLPETITAENCQEFCEAVVGPDFFISCTTTTVDGGEVAADCTIKVSCTGRRPAGLQSLAAGRTLSAVGAYLASCAHLEAASVPAFERLGAELAAHGAPRTLVRAAARAARDEVRHARVMARLARKAGAEPAAPRVAPVGQRDLETILAENRVEGCVRETFGAVIGCRQALAAGSPALRRALAAISRDELAHADLSWAVARWGERKLSRAARRRVAERAAEAVAELGRELQVAQPAEVRAALGLPDADEAQAIFARVRHDLWS